MSCARPSISVPDLPSATATARSSAWRKLDPPPMRDREQEVALPHALPLRSHLDDQGRPVGHLRQVASIAECHPLALRDPVQFATRAAPRIRRHEDGPVPILGLDAENDHSVADATTVM